MSETASVSADQLRQLLDLSRKLAVTIELDTLLPEAVAAITQMLQCERASVYFFDSEANELWTKVAMGSSEIRLPRGKGLAGAVFDLGQPLLVSDAYADPRFDRTTDQRTGFHTRDLLTVPMVDLEGQPVGVLQAVNSFGGFTSQHLDLLQLVAAQTGVAVQRHRLHQQVIESAQLRREMDLAAVVQTELLPKEVPQVASLDVAGWSLPASITGGDCYDLWQLDDGRLAMLVADAAGHGMAPAMVVAQVRSLVRLLAGSEVSPAEVLNRVNARLSTDLSPHRFVTAVLAYLDSDGQIELASAGHGPILIAPSPGEPMRELPATGLPLVIDPEPSVEALEPFTLERGGQLVLLSDGIFEAMSPHGDILGIERVQSAMRFEDQTSAQDQIAGIRAMVRIWSGDTMKDDQTIVIARRV